MPDDIGYHQARAARERTMAAVCPAGEARRLHLELAWQHEDKARSIRASLRRKPSEYDPAVRSAIAQSYALIDESHRVLAETQAAVDILM